jgi:hypothetical protein
VDPVPDPLLLRKSGSAGNRTRDLWICNQELSGVLYLVFQIRSMFKVDGTVKTGAIGFCKIYIIIRRHIHTNRRENLIFNFMILLGCDYV